MKERIDWSCHLLPHMREGVETPEEAVEAIRVLTSRCGLTQLCMTPRYDPENEPISVFLLRRDRAKRELEALLPPEYKLRYAAEVLLSPGLHETEGLERLCLDKTNRLPVALPLTDYNDAIDLELNRLLFKRHLKLLLLHFERCVALYPSSAIEKLIRIEDVAVEFHYRALTDADCCAVIRSLLRRNRTVLLGTGVDSLDSAWQLDPDLMTHSPSKGLTLDEFETLMRGASRFLQR